jgi:hypothetical protein
VPLQRDEEAIQRGRDGVWPKLLRRTQRERRVLIFEDESVSYLSPGLVRTYAPRAQPPILQEKQTHDHLSVMMRDNACEGLLTSAAVSLNGMHTIEFLTHPQRVASKRLLVIWDGSPICRRAAVKEFLASTSGKVSVEALLG